MGLPRAACIQRAYGPIINEEYGASATELDRARRLLAAFDAAAADGAGAVAFEGSMIDLPVVIRARRLLARAASWARSRGTNWTCLLDRRAPSRRAYAKAYDPRR